MNTLTKRIFAGVMFLVVAKAADWTEPLDIRYDTKKCVSYRARLNGDFLVIQATHEPGWHTIAMDNTRRAAEKLAGNRAALARSFAHRPTPGAACASAIARAAV